MSNALYPPEGATYDEWLERNYPVEVFRKHLKDRIDCGYCGQPTFLEAWPLHALVCDKMKEVK